MKDNIKGIDKISLATLSGVAERGVLYKKWTIEKYNKDGFRYGVEEIEGNLMLDEGVEELWKLFIGAGGATPFNNANAHIGVGDGTTAASAEQTGLIGVNKTYAPMDNTYPQVNGNTITLRATFGPSVGNHDWREFTVANGNTDNDINLNRKVESALRTKVSPDTWIVQLQITLS